jgi:hypothetical protein
VNKVHQRERVAYAATRHIKDERRRNTLLASTRHPRKIYKELSKAAHEDGHVDPEQARYLLAEVESLIRYWFQAMET